MQHKTLYSWGHTLPSQLSERNYLCSSVCGNQHTPRLLVPTKLETVGAMRAFGYVVQQWTAAAHFEQDNDGCWMAHSNLTFTLLMNVDQHHHCFS